MSKKPPAKTDLESILLRPQSEWEPEGGRNIDWDHAPRKEDTSLDNLSDTAIAYLAQIQDLQDQLDQEYLKVQRLEMAIKGFSISLEEEMKKGH